MRSKAFTVARLLALVLCFTALACTMVVRAASADAATQPVVLDDGLHEVPLAGRARWLLGEPAVATPDALEAAADSPSWTLRRPGDSYRVDGKALWVQFDAVNRASRPWFLELGSSGVDRAQLFFRRADGSWSVQEAGDTQPVSAWPLPGRLPTFQLAAAGPQPVRYWLRVEHSRFDFAAPLMLYDETALMISREKEQFFLGGYFSLALLVGLVSIGNALAYRDRNFAAYALYVGMLAVGQLAYLGVASQYVWDDWLRWNSLAPFLLPGLSSAAALWFTKVVTEPARYSRKLDIAVWAVIAATLSAVALDTAIETRLSVALVVGLAALSLVLVGVLVWFVWTQGEDPHVKFIALGFLPVLVMAVFPIARGFDLIPVSELTRFGVTIGAAIEMPILFYALSVRGVRRRESQTRAATLSRNDALTGLAHTGTLLQRLEAALSRAGSLQQACALLVVRISNQDTIVSEYGRETGDRSLVVAASLVRNVAADVDMAARVGDHEFAVLLEGPATTEDAMSRAQQIVASGLRPTEALPPSVTLRFHVAVALLPERGLGADGTLKWVRDGVFAMRPDARKLIRPLNF